ncbi:acetate--CoA ligase family protein [Leekyejoonella antrihumi]|uniref:CoA-binding protein n=1 Tax=Leekyejoonella antrihumi TaxID=1660198 RepID=A0A563E3B7_9MICO|nr:acetate--CoA ligase family protein [Leekyejoonella antrihumi]TWP37017.1 CoA-binding protein [Leekyejoonella antrihumi]
MPSSGLPPSLDLHAFTAPSSVAVVGASNNPAKWGYWLAAGALDGDDQRTVHLVNRSGGTVLGRRCFADLASLPEPPELVALCVPAQQVRAVVEDGLARGVRGFLGVTAGIPDEQNLADRIRDGGARLLGANSLGLYDADSNLRLAWGTFTPGPLAIVTQSGQLGSELAILCERSGVGISRFFSVGNQSDVRAIELLEGLVAHPSTRAVALYLEGFPDGEALFEVLRRLRAAGKPTLLLTVGASGASVRLARSHTGSLTSPLDLVDAACRAAGVLRVQTPRELVSVARGFLAVRTRTGRRVAIVGDSGGQCGIAADLASTEGLLVPELDERTSARLQSALPRGAARHNPVDLAGAGEADLTAYARVIDHVLNDPGIDATVVTGYFGRYGEDTPARLDDELQVAKRMATIARTHDKTVVVHSMSARSSVVNSLWCQGVPTVDSIQDAVNLVRGLASLSLEPPPAHHAQTLPGAGRLQPGYWAARALLRAAGVTLPAAHRVRSADDAREAARVLTAPFVLKAGWIDHKSEVEAVQLDLADGQSLAAAFERMRARLGDGDYVVEEQDTRPGCVEMLVGARRDPDLGSVVVVGRGGTESELWHDVAIERAPVSGRTAATMIGRLECAPLLAGWRHRPSLDGAALADLVVAISQLVVAHPRIAEVELNPVRVGVRGAVAVDALVIPTRDPPDAEACDTVDHTHHIVPRPKETTR